jgi:hypothetical protein
MSTSNIHLTNALTEIGGAQSDYGVLAQANSDLSSQLETLTQQYDAAQKLIEQLKTADALQVQTLMQQLAAAPWNALRGVTAIGNLHMLPAKTTDNIEVPGLWIDSGGHTAQSTPAANKTPHGTFAWTQGTFTTPGRIFFTPGAGWDNAFIYEHFNYFLPTLVRQRRIFSMLAGDMVLENCVEWQDEWISKLLACKFNCGWQWNRSAKIFRLFDQNAQTWRTAPVPYVELGTSQIEVIGEFILDPVAKTTTHLALTVAGVRTPVNVIQAATPAPGAADKFTISLLQLDSLGLGKPFGCNIHQCETLYI